MKDDLLSQATRALRESVDGASENARATEDRMLSLLPRRRRLRLVRPWGFSFAALLLGSSVWAMGGRAPIQSWLASLTGSETLIETPSPAEKVEPATPHRVTSRAAPIAVAHPDEPSEPEEDEAEPPHEPIAPAAPPRTRPLVPLPPAPADTTEQVPSSEQPAAAPEPTVVGPVGTGGGATGESALDVYERAHDLHFRRRDYAGALTAWERYLALAPSGSLALEARFHRGVCLVRLGRSEEARRVLEPFARGDYGTYRREQALKLLGERR